MNKQSYRISGMGVRYFFINIYLFLWNCGIVEKSIITVYMRCRLIVWGDGGIPLRVVLYLSLAGFCCDTSLGKNKCFVQIAILKIGTLCSFDWAKVLLF